MARTYTCSVCGNTYESGWSEEDAAAEYQQNFGAVLADEDANVVCDDCYKQFMSWLAERGELRGIEPSEVPSKFFLLYPNYAPAAGMLHYARHRLLQREHAP